MSKAIITNYTFTVVSPGVSAIIFNDLSNGNGVELNRILYIRNVTTQQDIYKAGGDQTLFTVSGLYNEQLDWYGDNTGMNTGDNLLIFYEHIPFFGDVSTAGSSNYPFQKTIFQKMSTGQEGSGTGSSGNGTITVYARSAAANDPWIAKKVRVVVWGPTTADLTFVAVNSDIAADWLVSVPYTEVQYGKEYLGVNNFSMTGNARVFEIDATGYQFIRMAVANIVGANIEWTNSDSEGAYIPGAPDVHRKLSAATNNATSVTTRWTLVKKISVYNNTGSAKFLKLYNKVSAPAPATDTALLVVKIPIGPNANRDIEFPNGLSFIAGLAYAITGAIADADNTSIAASDVELTIYYR